MKAPDFDREPWKHPAVWSGHIVRRTRDYPAGVAVSVATCECGWACCARVARGGANEVAIDDATHDHWLEVIEQAVPA